MTLPSATPEPAHGHGGQRTLRRRFVRVPPPAPSADAVFLVLRRMRAPLIVVVVVFTISVAGLTLVPGLDDQGMPYQMSVFDAFYLMSYTALTIGFGETPYELVREQRLWLTICIYASVIGWAYALGALLSLLQDKPFRDALARQSFVRRVKRLRRPFLILVGYGQMGRLAAETLDTLGRSTVVVAADQESVDALAGAQLSSDIPGLVGDARDPGVLGLAGLGSKYCAGVLALTDSDAVNLSIVMAVTLLRHDVPVIARANSRGTAKAMREFGASAVVNPFERYGNYLVMRVRRPSTYRLLTWLLAAPGTLVSPDAEEHEDGLWVIASDDHFGPEIAADLEDAGLDSTLVDVDAAPDVEGAVGFIAGGSDDAQNLALAGHARLVDPDLFLAVRQRSKRNDALLRAFAPDSVFVPAQLTVQEALARVVTPDFWEFVAHVWEMPDDEAEVVLDRLLGMLGRGSPDSHRIVVGEHDTPAVVRRLRGGSVRLGDLFRHPADRDGVVAAVPVLVLRGDEHIYLPGDDEEVRSGDVLISVGTPRGLTEMADALHYDHVLEHLVTGEDVPATWLGRTVRGWFRRG
ncbi:NAD-binding protein [Propioniciclava sp. MC1683]|uniref:NAD(P)-binding protein n=1 Tax=Propioniciclava sp. MC1683 TaxID=2760309 RepID=UPI001603F032|nr:NAD(P)-binding protein [Propioniciclava sp. MC1683]MBB1500424.1 NAD-binding protein [Propioniciclava sp. MC1683]